MVGNSSKSSLKSKVNTFKNNFDKLAARFVVTVFLATLTVPFARADIVETIKSSLTKVIEIGSFSFLGVPAPSMLMQLFRFLLIILIFTVIFAMLTWDKLGQLAFLRENKAHAAIVALILGIMAGVFTPINVIGAMSVSWATATTLILIGAPIAGMMYLVYSIPFGADVETRATLFMKFILCFLLVWILSAMHHYFGVLRVGSLI